MHDSIDLISFYFRLILSTGHLIPTVDLIKQFTVYIASLLTITACRTLYGLHDIATMNIPRGICGTYASVFTY